MLARLARLFAIASQILHKCAGKCKAALKWFGGTEGRFLVAFGRDGCPFGKNESACSFLISFLNVGKRVAVFGGNVEETSPIVKRYINSVYKQLVDLEGRIFEINGLHVSFHFEELPNDMKMLAMLGGELSNSATFFSTFANVSTNDCTDLRDTFGSSPSCQWKPWQYVNRLMVVKAVDSLRPHWMESLCQQNKRGPTLQNL